jgi:transposase
MKATHFVGIDIASESFVATVVTATVKGVSVATQFANEAAGYGKFESWLAEQGLEQATTALCLEATGVYGEELAYWLTANQWWVSLLPPLDVKRASAGYGHKNDAVDSERIGQYGARYADKLHRFVPKPDLLEQVKVLLQLREQYVGQKTAQHNVRHAIRRKVVQTPLADAMLEQSLAQLSRHIKALEVEIRRLFTQDPDLNQQLHLLLTIPGVGLLLASHMLILAASLRTPYNPKVAAAHLGLAPFEYESGSSVWRPPASRRFGPSTIRKLLHLAARCRRAHHPPSRAYFERKLLAGKPPRLILNNLANRLIRVMCAVLRTRQPYFPDYQSLPPLSLSSP